MKKIAIVSSYPPPYGGISIYTERLSDFLAKNRIEHKIYTTKYLLSKKIHKEQLEVIKNRIWWLFKMLLCRGEIVIHCNKTTPFFYLSCLILKYFRGKKYILNRHGEYLYGVKEIKTGLKERVKKHIFDLAFCKADHIIIVNDKMRTALNELDINRNRISNIPAFIAPADEDRLLLPKTVERFMKSYKYIIASNGWIKMFNNQDLYGIDLMTDMMTYLKNKNAGLIIYISGADQMTNSEKKYYSMIKEKISDEKLKDKILIYESQNDQFWPVLKKADIFIRPTITDGDSVSVREALYFGVAVLCSDATERPEGVQLFKNRDLADMVRQVCMLIDDLKKSVYNRNMRLPKQENNAEKILKIYRKLISGKINEDYRI